MDRNLAIKKKAQQLIAKGQIDAALAEFDRLFESGDKDPYDFILVADLLAKRGSMQEAVRRYRQAVDEYSKADLFKNAIAVCKRILRISKEDLEIHRSLGQLYAKEGLYGDAIIHYLEYAEGSIRRQDHDAALNALDEVLKLSPENKELSEKYVEIAMRADQPERGGRELLRRADLAEHEGRSSEAAELRERASTLAPGMDLAVSDHAEETAGPVNMDAPISTPSAPSGATGIDAIARAGADESAHVPEPGVISLTRDGATGSGGEPADPVANHAELATGYLSAG
ncbi:MAG TPA: tetratricopeptide repeat protein, partial [Candidatus Eisenbacteria bacterium]|nr:tetratricopeptide repeat protein [Candidatus Eisenbacteria bacterium]